jgi:hypothetical protein
MSGNTNVDFYIKSGGGDPVYISGEHFEAGNMFLYQGYVGPSVDITLDHCHVADYTPTLHGTNVLIEYDTSGTLNILGGWYYSTTGLSLIHMNNAGGGPQNQLVSIGTLLDNPSGWPTNPAYTRRVILNASYLAAGVPTPNLNFGCVIDVINSLTLSGVEQYNDLLGWSFDLAEASGNTALAAAGYLCLVRIPLPYTMSITSIHFYLHTIGATLTNSFVALYSSAGTLIGQSVDQSSAWGTGGTAGALSVALAGGPFICSPLAANDFVWAGFYVGASSAAFPAFDIAAQSSNVVANIGTTTARYRSVEQYQASTAALANINPAANATGYLYWVGLS